MAEFKYYNGFTLTNPITGKTKSLSDFNGIIYNPDNEKMTRTMLSEPTHITDKNDNCDGEQYIKTRYGTRIIEIPVFFKGTVDEMELNKWLGCKRQQVFAWEDDDDNKCIDVIYQKPFDMNIYYGQEFNAYTMLSFIAHNPHWYIKNEREIIYKNPQINEVKIIKCRGNSDSFPLIKVVPNSTQSKIRFKWNTLVIELSNVNKPIYIDCKKERCYEMNGDIMTLVSLKYKSDNCLRYPFISADIKNAFILLEGKVNEISIQPRTLII